MDEFETCVQCGTEVPQTQCIYKTFMEYLKKNYKPEESWKGVGHPLINFYDDPEREQSYNFEFCSEECIERFKESRSEGQYIIVN